MCLDSAARPPGWTWTKQPTWYSDRYHWDVWTVVDCFVDETNNVPWYFSDGSAPRVANDGRFYFDAGLWRQVEEHLTKLWLCIDSIVSNPPFILGTGHPTKFNYLHLSSGWDSAQSASSVVEDAKAQVKEYLGFLNWWSSSVTHWGAPLERWMINYIASFRLCSLKKRGVLVDVVQHCRTLNVGHLLAENVPLYYYWMKDMESLPQFLRLSPVILQAYHDTCEALDKAEVFSVEMIGYQSKLDMIKRYDDFFQLQQDPGNMFSPQFADIHSDMKVYMCDFKGWKGRLLIDVDTIAEYSTCYHFTIDESTPGTTVTIWRWRPRVTDTGCNQKAGQEGAGATKETQRGDRKICEIFKGT